MQKRLNNSSNKSSFACSPNISFKLFNNGKKVLHTYGDGNLINSIRTIYGKNISEHVLPFKYEDDDLKIHGFIGKEIIARGSRNNESIFVNNRISEVLSVYGQKRLDLVVLDIIWCLIRLFIFLGTA